MTKDTMNFGSSLSEPNTAPRIAATYLDNDTDEDESLVLSLLVDTAPPELRAEKPVPGATDSTPSLGE